MFDYIINNIIDNDHKSINVHVPRNDQLIYIYVYCHKNREYMLYKRIYCQC